MMTSSVTETHGRSPGRQRLALHITLPVAIVSIVLLAVGAGGAWHVHRLQQNISETLAMNVASVRAAQELEILIRDTRTSLNGYLISGESSHLRNIPLLRTKVNDWLKKTSQLTALPEEQELLRGIREGYDHFIAEFRRRAQGNPETLTREDAKALANDILSREVLVYTDAYLDFNSEEISRSSQQNQDMASRLALGLLLFGTCGAVGGMIAGFGIARGINRKIIQLIVPVRDVAGRLNEVVGPVSVSADLGLDELEVVLQKVSERVADVIDQLHQTQREALRAEQLAAVGQLAAGLAHELRNPLMAMKILIQSTANRQPPAALDKNDLHVLEEEISRLEKLVRSFLDFARPPRLEKRALRLRDVVEPTLGLVAHRATQCGIQLSFEEHVPEISVEADIGQIRQVLLNLLLNAVDATPSGGWIRVEADVAECSRADSAVRDSEIPGSERGGETVVISVADSGFGLPSELGPRIFDPFVSTKETGIGLGLSICKRIIEAHGGRIAAENGESGGAVLTVSLPRVRSDAVVVGDRRRESYVPAVVGLR